MMVSRDLILTAAVGMVEKGVHLSDYAYWYTPG